MHIRRATARDKRAITTFCYSVDPEDYVPEYLDRMMANGTFLLLFDGKRLVGLDRFGRKPDNSVWMSAGRIHPDYRGHGLINQMNDHAITLPELAGVRAVRMLIAKDNTSSRRAAQKGGYNVCSAHSVFEWEGKPKAKRSVARPSGFVPATATEIRLALSNSRSYAATNGIVYFPPDYGRLTPEVLAQAQRGGRLFLSPKAGPMLISERREAKGLDLSLQPFARTAAGAARVFDFVAERAPAFAQLSVVDEAPVLRAYKAAGFTISGWGPHVLVYEKLLRPSYARRVRAARLRRA